MEQGCPSSLNKIPLSGEVELLSFFLGLSLIYWHLDWFSLLISRNWRVRQDLLFYFRHYVQHIFVTMESVSVSTDKLPADIRSSVVSCAKDDSMFVVECVALLVNVKSTTIKIATSMLPVKTRWSGSSTPESGFASLLDPGSRGASTGWLSGEVLSVYCHILAQTLGWGTVNKPPESGQRVWLADTFMYQKWEDTGDFYPTLNLECGVSGDFAKLKKFRNNS